MNVSLVNLECAVITITSQDVPVAATTAKGTVRSFLGLLSLEYPPLSLTIFLMSANKNSFSSFSQ